MSLLLLVESSQGPLIHWIIRISEGMTEGTTRVLLSNIAQLLHIFYYNHLYIFNTCVQCNFKIPNGLHWLPLDVEDCSILIMGYRHNPSIYSL